MKRAVFSVAVALFLCSCEVGPKRSMEPVVATFPDSVEVYSDPQLFIVRIRGCEYLRCPGYAGFTYEHAGDCSNPIHGGTR